MWSVIQTTGCLSLLEAALQQVESIPKVHSFLITPMTKLVMVLPIPVAEPLRWQPEVIKPHYGNHSLSNIMASITSRAISTKTFLVTS